MCAGITGHDAESGAALLGLPASHLGLVPAQIELASDMQMQYRSSFAHGQALLLQAGHELARPALNLLQRHGPRTMALGGRVWDLGPQVEQGLRQCLPTDQAVQRLSQPAQAAAAPGRAAHPGGRQTGHYHRLAARRPMNPPHAPAPPQALRRRALALAGAALTPAWLAACASSAYDTRYTATGQDSRVMFLVLHFTNEDFANSLRILTQQQVSAHYLLSDETPPRIYRLVDEQRRAWHAGASFWQGSSMLNASSIGIEIVNAGPVKQADGSLVFAPYPPAQIDLLLQLVKDIVARHQIRPDRIVGHSDIAPQRKPDPGPMFPWQRLAAEGLIPWPDPARLPPLLALYEASPPTAAWFQQMLARVGYQVPDNGEFDAATRRVLSAFQMKYRPARHDGQPDAQTAALLQVLNNSALPAR